jgi:hypothetical protein
MNEETLKNIKLPIIKNAIEEDEETAMQYLSQFDFVGKEV